MLCNLLEHPLQNCIRLTLALVVRYRGIILTAFSVQSGWRLR